MHLSPKYFSKLFADISGNTFLEYLTGIRLDKAKELLRSTDTPVTYIALDCGFGSFPSFSRAFKQLVGCTSTDYRRFT